MPIERDPGHFPRASHSTSVDSVVIMPGDHQAFQNLFNRIPNCEKVVLSSFLAGPEENYFEDVTLYFNDSSVPGEPFSLYEFVPGSPTRKAIEAALEQFDEDFDPLS